MAGGPSPSASSASSISPLYGANVLSSSSSPPSQSLFSSSNNSSKTISSSTTPSAEPILAPIGTSSAHSTAFNNLSSISERKPLDMATNASSLLAFAVPDSQASTSPDKMDSLASSILIRKLPRGTSIDFVRALLLFAKDFLDVAFVDGDSEDKGYATAVARFGSFAAASDARDKLDGKTLGNDATRIVVEMQLPMGSLGRRNTGDGTAALRNTTSNSSGLSSTSSIAAPIRQSSRFGGTFQSLEKMSPPNGDVLSPASIWSPQSPIGTSAVSSKSIINDDPTDETGKLLSATVEYGSDTDPSSSAALHDSTPLAPLREPTTFGRAPGGPPQIPTARLAGLSLSTAGVDSNHVTSPPLSALVSPRTLGPAQSPNPGLSPVSALANGMSPLTAQGYAPLPPSAQLQQPTPFAGPNRPSYPPVNPADQNPPCNTLYVGNLPMDTSEDELKAIFSKQRGYKRLCYRTKANGPMCFVEFEDTGFATRCLKQLYGHPLSNSTKGGIRLSFSKNPLGVRSSQNPSNNHHAAHAHAAAAAAVAASMSASVVGAGHPSLAGLNGGITGTGGPVGGAGAGVQNSKLFATATGPPPGLLPPVSYAPGSHSGVNSGASSTSSNATGLGVYGNNANGSGHNTLASGFGGLSGLGSPNGGFGVHQQHNQHHPGAPMNHHGLGFGAPLRQPLSSGVPSSMAGSSNFPAGLMSEYTYMGH